MRVLRCVFLIYSIAKLPERKSSEHRKYLAPEERDLYSRGSIQGAKCDAQITFRSLEPRAQK